MARAALVLSLCLILFPLPIHAEEGAWQAAPTPKTATIPTPPRQTAPWTVPKTDLPDGVVRAAAALFEAGLADPRGCEYRQVRLDPGKAETGVHKDDAERSAYGWVLPAAGKSDPRFAVCWDGVVRPLRAVGPKADLESAIRQLVRKPAEPNPHHRLLLWDNYSEDELVSAQTPLPLKAGLLLRLGKGRAAAELWRISTAHYKKPPAGKSEVYKILARDWLFSLFNRAGSAHERGDDAVALSATRRLAEGLRRVRAVAAKRKIGLPAPKPFGFLGFLEDAKALIEDHEARAKLPKRKPALEVGLENFPTDKARIEALIADLGNARDFYDPFGDATILGADTFTALTRQGKAAVEPLLKCMEADKRLTRVRYLRFGGHGTWRFQSVARAAWRALSDILDGIYEEPGDDWNVWELKDKSGWPAVAAKIRAYWRKHKHRSAHHRWLELLSHRRSTRAQWLDALRRIAPPESAAIRRIAQDIVELFSEDDGRKDEPKIRIQSPRKGPDAKVTKAIRMRMRELVAGDKPLTKEDYDALTQTGVGLLNWDPQVAESMFVDPKSPWRAMIAEKDAGFFKRFEVFADPRFMCLKSFRKHVLAKLADRTVIGKIVAYFPHVYTIQLGDYARQDVDVSKSDPLRMPELDFDIAERSVRMCDLYAYSLGRSVWLSRMQPYWPKAAKDKAIEQIATVLKRFGGRFTPPCSNADDLVFPALDRPASAKQAKAGEAIFSLEGLGQRRLWKMPKRPLAVRWIDPRRKEVHLRDRTWPEEDDRHGWIWQAEEVKVGGAWKRYFGFVGRGVIAKVPADQVELPAEDWEAGDWEWVRLTGGLDSQLEVTEESGKPVLVLRLRNRRGADVRLPWPLIRRNATEGPALQRGIEIVCWYSAKFPPEPEKEEDDGGGLFGDDDDDDEPVEEVAPAEPYGDLPWKPLAATRTTRFADKATRRLRAGRSIIAMRMPLGRWFDCSRPGVYAVQVRFNRKNGGPVDDATDIVRFTVGSRPPRKPDK